MPAIRQGQDARSSMTPTPLLALLAASSLAATMLLHSASSGLLPGSSTTYVRTVDRKSCQTMHQIPNYCSTMTSIYTILAPSKSWVRPSDALYSLYNKGFYARQQVLTIPSLQQHRPDREAESSYYSAGHHRAEVGVYQNQGYGSSTARARAA